MFRWLSLLGEKARNALSSPGWRAYRDGKNVEHQVAKLPGLEKDLQQSVAGLSQAGSDRPQWANKASRVMEDIRKVDEREAYLLFDQLVQVRLLAAKQLRLLGYIKHSVDFDIKHSGLPKDQQEKLEKQFTQEFERDRVIIEQMITDIFQSETSAESTNFSLRTLQRLDTKARELSNNYLRAKRLARQATRDEKKLESKARHTKAIVEPSFLKRVTGFRQHLREETAYLQSASRYTIMLLQDDKADLQSKEGHLKQLLLHSGNPMGIGEDVVKNFDSTILSIHHGLQEEIAKKRIELSHVKHMAA